MSDPTSYVITPAGGNRESTVLRGLGSVVSIADVFVPIDTGESAQESIHRITSTFCRVHTIPSVFKDADFCCTSVRNEGLDGAAQLASHNRDANPWALMLDTDEWLNLNGFDVRRYLATTKANCIQVASTARHGRVYTKERFIRLPTAGRYVSADDPALDLHEEYLGDGVVREVMPVVTFDETEKTPEELAASMLETERRCRARLERDPGDLRARFYLGNTLHYRGDIETDEKQREAFLREAIEHYFEYANKTESNDEHGWSMFRTAQCYDLLAKMLKSNEMRIKSKEMAVRGMARCARPELAWWAGVQSALMSNPIETERWARACVGIGETTGCFRMPHSVLGFQYPPASWEAPWELLRDVFRSVTEHAKKSGEVPAAMVQRYVEEMQRCAQVAMMSKAERVGVRL